MSNVYMGLDVEDFIFGEGTSFEDNFDNVTDEDMNRFGIIECTEDPDVACYRIALENEQNHSAIMMAMMNAEYSVLESTGHEMVYEGTRLNNFLDAVKAQVQKFWAKVKGVFKKVMDQISSIVLSNKAFVKKYRAVAGEIKKPVDKGFTGYEFGDLVVNYSNVSNFVKGIKNAAADAEKSLLDNIRGRIVGENSVSAEDFNKKLKVKFYGSENTKTINVDSSFADLLNRLESAADQKKAAKAAHKEAEKSIKEYLSEINKLKSEASSNDNNEDVKKYKVIGQFITKSLNIMSVALSAQTRAIIAQAIQDRKMANYWVNAQNKKKGTQESAVDTDLGVEII